jgi:hypothetical protein
MAKVIHAEVLELANKLSNEITVKDGQMTIAENAYVGTLPEGLTVEKVEELQKHNSLFYPAVTHAFGEKAVEMMKKDKKLMELGLTVPMVGRDHFDLDIKRSKTYPNPQDENAPVTKYGQINAQLVTHAARANRGEMNSVRDMISEMALASLTK